jgi:Fis family transcriptional regulator, factor for inversion stimulation protein
MTSAAPTSIPIDTHRPALASAAPVTPPRPGAAPLPSASAAPRPGAAPAPASLDDDWPTLDELSLRYLHRVIEHAKGNKTKAAEVLGIDRRTVSRILSKASRQGKPPTMQTANRK